MARQAWQRTITDAAGNVLTGVQITVFQADGVTLATIYGQLTGGSALANPFSTGAQTSAKFYADPGRYVVRAFKDGLTQEFTDVDIGGKAVREDLGSAAYLTAAVGQSDSTIGRALKVGDFSLGKTGALINLPVATLDELNINGAFSVAGNTPGWPFGGSGGVVTHRSHGDGLFSVQEVAEAQSERIAVRFRQVTGSWTNWGLVYHSRNVLGTVEFSSGVNAGAIIERGANSNGEFVKFADGTLICTFNRSASLAMAGYSSGVYFGQFTWSFPAQFNGGVGFVGASYADNFAPGWASCVSTNSTQCVITCYSAGASNTGTFTQVTAVGRWR